MVRYQLTLDSVPSVRDWSGEVAISPDGEVIVHTGGPNGALLLRRRNELAFLPLASTERAQGPFFSPDGARVGYFSEGRLMVAALAGGPATLLDASITEPEAMSWSDAGVIYRAWRDDSSRYLIGRMEARARAPVEQYSARDTSTGEREHLLPDALPRGRGVLFTVSYQDGRREIAVADAASPRRHRLLFPGTRARYARNGRILYTTADGNLWSVPFDLNALEVTGTPMLVSEGVPMTMLAHMLNFGIPEDVAFAEVRARPGTMAAEDILHDMGAISIFATDTQGMGRLAENLAKCWQLASVMKDRTGRLPEETTARADNERIKRYVAKYTINPAIAAGIDAHVGSIEPSKMADLVLWPRASFGIKPFLVIKGGFVTWSAIGDGNGSIMLSEPMIQRPMWGAIGRAKNALSAVFVSKLAMESGAKQRLDTQKPWVPISSVRALRKTDMVRNAALPKITVNPQTHDCYADGKHLWVEPVTRVPLSRKYMLR